MKKKCLLLFWRSQSIAEDGHVVKQLKRAKCSRPCLKEHEKTGAGVVASVCFTCPSSLDTPVLLGKNPSQTFLVHMPQGVPTAPARRIKVWACNAAWPQRASFLPSHGDPFENAQDLTTTDHNKPWKFFFFLQRL